MSKKPAPAVKTEEPISFRDAYYNDRIAFAQEIMGLTLEKWQYGALKALDEGKPKISIRSGHGVGKTCFLSICILHFLLTRAPPKGQEDKDCKIAVTAPSAGQLESGLLPEIQKWWLVVESKVPQFKGYLNFGTSTITLVRAPKQCFCTFKTSRREAPEALQGVHATHTMLVADEASGVDEKVFESAGGSMSTKGAILLMTGNPTRTSGFFYDSHHKHKADWHCIKVSGFDSSQVNETYINSEKRYGEESNRYRVRVLGEFPKGDENTLIARDLVERAIGRKIHAPRTMPIYWGLDVARSLYGDKSSLAKRKGPVVLEPVKRYAFANTMQLVGAIRKEYEDAREDEKPEAIFVDVIGVGGGVLDRLLELDVPAVGVNVGDAPGPLSKGVKLRDELWLNLRDWFMTEVVSFPDDPDTVEEIITPIVAFRSDGREKVESKDEMRARGALGGKSPDGADAVMMTFARDGAVTAGAMQGASRSKGPLRRSNTRRV